MDDDIQNSPEHDAWLEKQKQQELPDKLKQFKELIKPKKVDQSSPSFSSSIFSDKTE